MNIDNKNIQNELIYFKEEVLKDIKIEISKMSTKIDNQRDSVFNQISLFEKKIALMSDRIIAMSNKISEDKTLKEKVSNLTEFKEKTKETLSFHDSKFNYQSKMIIDAINKMDYFINENILYNDVIGPTPNCKFQNFHNFIDYIISNITQLNTFKDKTVSMDYKNYKSKIESSIETLRTQLINNSKGNNNYAKNLVEKEEEKYKEIFKLYDGKIDSVKMENSKYINNIKINFENMEKEWVKIIKIRDEIYEKIDKEIETFNKINKHIETKLDKHQIICTEQNENLKKIIKDIYNKIEKIKLNIKDLTENSSNFILKGFKKEKNEIKKEEIKEINKEEIKQEIKNNKFEERKKDSEDKEVNNEENEINNENKKGDINHIKNKNAVTESPIRQYIEGKMNYSQASHFKNIKKIKFAEDKKVGTSNSYSSENRQLKYLEYINNIINNPKINTIYKAKFKEVQNFIDKIIIGSVIKSHINKEGNLNDVILSNIRGNQNLKLKNEKNSDYYESKFRFNENLKEESYNLTNKENITSSNKDNLNDKIFEDINNKNKNNSFGTALSKNIELNSNFNKKATRTLLKDTKSSHSQILIYNNDSFDKNKIKLLKPNNTKKTLSLKKVKSQDYIKRNSTLNIDNEEISNNNKIIENIYDKSKRNTKKENDKIINIINYSNKNNSQRFIYQKNNSQANLPMANIFENSLNNPSLNKSILIKNDINSIKNYFGFKNLTNKKPKSNLSLYDSSFKRRYNKNKMEIISMKQIQNSIKYLDSQEKNSK